MKKLLLFGCGILTALSALSATPVKQPEIFGDQTLEALSPNGEWSAGLFPDGFGTVIRNYATGQQYIYPSSVTAGGDLQESYIMGGSKCISNDGTVVGIRNDKAAYWKDGRWNYLDNLSDTGLSAAKAITPDGKYIVGYASRVGLSLDIVQIAGMPAMWELQEDGTYGKVQILPFPTKDITGRLPRYVNALGVSDDGSVIAASMYDYLGSLCQPVVIYKNESGEYVAESLGAEIMNPTGIVMPKYPGEFDDLAPNWEEYMTAQQMQQYERAFDQWVANGEKPADQPFPQDFMDAQNRAAYMELFNAWWSKFEPWQKAYEEYEAALGALMDNGKMFQFNNALISPDGKTLVSTSIREILTPNPEYGDFDIIQHYAPVAFSIPDGTATEYSDEYDVYATCITADGSILGNVLDFNGVKQKEAYIYPQGQPQAITLFDWVMEKNPELGDWMEENMTHKVFMLDANNAVIEKEMVCTGIPTATPDLSLIGTCIGTGLWVDDWELADIFAYILPMDYMVEGVEGITDDAGSTLTLLPGGIVALKGDFASLKVYDMAGTQVVNLANPQGEVATGLGSGIYIVRAQTADGRVLTRKAAF